MLRCWKGCRYYPESRCWTVERQSRCQQKFDDRYPRWSDPDYRLCPFSLPRWICRVYWPLKKRIAKGLYREARPDRYLKVFFRAGRLLRHLPRRFLRPSYRLSTCQVGQPNYLAPSMLKKRRYQDRDLRSRSISASHLPAALGRLSLAGIDMPGQPARRLAREASVGRTLSAGHFEHRATAQKRSWEICRSARCLGYTWTWRCPFEGPARR